MPTRAQLNALLLTLAQQTFQAIYDLYGAINTNDTALAAQRRADIVKYKALSDTVNDGLAQMNVIVSLGGVVV